MPSSRGRCFHKSWHPNRVSRMLGFVSLPLFSCFRSSSKGPEVPDDLRVEPTNGPKIQSRRLCTTSTKMFCRQCNPTHHHPMHDDRSFLFLTPAQLVDTPHPAATTRMARLTGTKDKNRSWVCVSSRPRRTQDAAAGPASRAESVSSNNIGLVKPFKRGREMDDG